MSDKEAYDELSLYTLAHTSPEFIHQYIVDAYAAEHTGVSSKPIYLDFALAGLYLHNEKGFTGKQVQNAHMELVKHKERLPHFAPTDTRDALTVYVALSAQAGEERDDAIRAWSASVWDAYEKLHPQIKAWVDAELETG